MANGADLSNSIGILLDSNNNYYCNNNVFIKPCFENIDTAIQINYGNQNQFEHIRSEDNNYTFKTYNNSRGNSCYIGDGDMTADLNDNTNRIITQPEKSFGHGLKIIDLDMVKNSEINDTNLNMTNFVVMHQGGSTSASITATNNYELNNNYLVQKVTKKGLGFYVKTDKVKKFLMRKITEAGYAGRYFIKCFDNNKTVIANSTISLTAIETLSPRTEITNSFINSTNDARDILFILPEEVKYIFVGVTKINTDLHIRNFILYGENNTTTSTNIETL